jgi:hypothetical protein
MTHITLFPLIIWLTSDIFSICLEKSLENISSLSTRISTNLFFIKIESDCDGREGVLAFLGDLGDLDFFAFLADFFVDFFAVLGDLGDLDFFAFLADFFVDFFAFLADFDFFAVLGDLEFLGRLALHFLVILSLISPGLQGGERQYPVMGLRIFPDLH